VTHFGFDTGIDYKAGSLTEQLHPSVYESISPAGGCLVRSPTPHVSIPMARPDAVSDAARDILDRIHAARI